MWKQTQVSFNNNFIDYMKRDYWKSIQVGLEKNIIIMFQLPEAGGKENFPIVMVRVVMQ